MNSPFLHHDALVELTGYKRKSEQVKQLARMGIPFLVNASGIPKVLKDALSFGIKVEAQPKKEWKPKVKF